MSTHSGLRICSTLPAYAYTTEPDQGGMPPTFQCKAIIPTINDHQDAVNFASTSFIKVRIPPCFSTLVLIILYVIKAFRNLNIFIIDGHIRGSNHIKPKFQYPQGKLFSLIDVTDLVKPMQNRRLR